MSPLGPDDPQEDQANERREDRDGDTISASGATASLGNTIHSFNAAANSSHNGNNESNSMDGNTATSAQLNLLQQHMHAFLQQAQQNQQMPPAQQVTAQPAQSIPILLQQLQQQQIAAPMLVNALTGSQPSSTQPSSADVNNTLLLATTQLIQYQNLAHFLIQLLAQSIGPAPLQMLLSAINGFLPTGLQTSLTGLPPQPQQMPQQLPQQLVTSFLLALGQLMSQGQDVSGSSSSGSNTTMLQAALNALQQQASAQLPQHQNIFPSGGESGSNGEEGNSIAMPLYPSGAANQVPASGHASFTNNAGADGTMSPPTSGQPPISPPRRKKRKYDHESFPEKLHRLLRDAHENNQEDIVRFTNDGTKFEILNAQAFENEVLPQYFRHNRINSFKRLLRMYAFRRIQGTWMEGMFEHPLFHRDHPDWCKQIQRNAP